MRKRFASFLVAGALLLGAPFGQAAADSTPAKQSADAVVAKRCSGGYRHAIIGGRHKCLRRGQFCARRYDRSYHRYGFHCHRGRLTR